MRRGARVIYRENPELFGVMEVVGFPRVGFVKCWLDPSDRAVEVSYELFQREEVETVEQFAARGQKSKPLASA